MPKSPTTCDISTAVLLLRMDDAWAGASDMDLLLPTELQVKYHAEQSTTPLTEAG
jgi:hypothetical protein